MTATERAVALLWWHGREEHNFSATAAQLADEMVAAGYPKQNISRLRGALARDARTAKGEKGGFRIRISARSPLDTKFGLFAGARRVRRSDSVLPMELFSNSRGYIEKVVAQLNASYDHGL